jgi:Tol biopolymer transport system component
VRCLTLRFVLCLLPVIAVSCCALEGSIAHAARQPGATRALTVRFADDLPLMQTDSSLSQPVIGVPSVPAPGALPAYPLFFTRASDGERNIYRAELQLRRAPSTPGAAGSALDESPAELNGDTRFMTSVAPLLATPVTRLVAPFKAHSAAPLPDGRTLLCVSNALTPLRERLGGFDQIVRLDLRTGAMRALTPADARHDTPAVSPDGLAFVYTVETGASEAIYIAPTDTMRAPGVQPQLVASFARHPMWLDDNTLIFENLRPGATGLSRLDLRGKSRGREAGISLSQQLWQRGGQSSFDGRFLCVVAPRDANADAGATRLYLMAADGSGARALAGTDGAASPAFAPDGSFLLYDAPRSTVEIDRTSASSETARSLWMIPMRRVAPVARLDSVRALPGNTFAVVGTAFSNDDTPRAVIEWGEGKNPARWKALPASAPVYSGILARWTPPSPSGDWTLRLRVEDGEGDSSQSVLSVALPLRDKTVSPVPTPPIFAVPIPASRPAIPDTASPLPELPVPALPPAPVGPRDTGSPAERAPEAQPSSRPAPPPIPAPRPQPRPASKPTPRPTLAPTPQPPANPTPVAGTGDAAVLTVSGVPYQVLPGETLNLSAMLRNTGRNGWKTTGDSAVRLLVRWHDTKTKARIRWAVRWLRADVPPGGTARLDFSVPAPPRAGDYILRFSLVRVGRDGYTPPPYSQSASDRYPGEFGVATTSMPVRP